MEPITKWLKKPWKYWVGGVLLGTLNVALLAISGTSWHITSGILLGGTGILESIGLEPFKWKFFEIFDFKYGDIISSNSAFINKYTIMNLGIVLGALIATLLASQFSFKKIKNKKHVAFGLAGGIMMGYGARLTSGCNIGSFFSGIPSFSLHAWVYWIFVVLGAWVGTKILTKYLL